MNQNGEHQTAFRVATYNVHKCCGLDRRVRPSRIAQVLGEIDADVVALQEVIGEGEGDSHVNHARHIADELGYDFCIGANRRHVGGEYGNAVLTRHRLIDSNNLNITHANREPRGCLQVDVEIGNRPVRIFNVHLGTAFSERRHQARMLLSFDELKEKSDVPRIVLGDFNEWTRGLASQMFKHHFTFADPREHLKTGARTYPGVLPFLHLDHIYFDASLRLTNLTLHRNRTSLIASDHLPLVADFAM